MESVGDEIRKSSNSVSYLRGYFYFYPLYWSDRFLGYRVFPVGPVINEIKEYEMR